MAHQIFSTIIFLIAFTINVAINVSASAQSFTMPNPTVDYSVGNKYFYSGYYWHHGGFNRKWDFYEQIVGDTVLNDQKYAVIFRSGIFSDLPSNRFFFDQDTSFYFYKRADSSKVYFFDSDKKMEIIIADFEVPAENQYPFGYVFFKEQTTVLNEIQLVLKTNSDFGFFRSYSTKFGVIQYAISRGGESGNSVLRGAIINDIVYGDTSIVTSIKEIGRKILPKKIVLHQNYPNPFNPNTTISFEIPNSGFATLTVYDTNGRHVHTLVDEYVQKGHYEIEFDGDGLSSGI
ncbi:MAG: T9SS type A sorting domain-containing protein, partial [bacterium]